MTDLTSQETHFAFGENWRSFAQTVDAERIANSDAGLAKLFEPGELAGKHVLDIGSGSGLPALSILRAGAAHVDCVDIDSASTETTTALLTANAPAASWSARTASVFDLSGQYDVVHSWGVLHHTGAMWDAIDKAASLVRPGGLLAIAIYCKTPLCGFWRAEKRIYRRLPRAFQLAVLGLFTAWRVVLGAILQGRPFSFLSDYGARGMDWWHDQHDWLGGYPYESATPEEMRAFLESRGLVRVRERLLTGNRRGLLGSGCDEYVFRRPAST